MIKLSTAVDVPSYDFTITPDARGLVVGSCFAASLGERLAGGGGQVEVNPSGVVYNPLSMALAAENYRYGTRFSASDLVERDGLWHSFSYHGSFSDPDPDRVLGRINREAAVGVMDYIVLTLGTAYVYERGGEVVANCHKFPEREFTRRRITVTETVAALARVRAAYPSAYILLTVSPIRHLRDGLSANSASKATLRLACEEFVAVDHFSGYFPSYEIVIDELRDYRFYAADMTHPTPLAVDLVFEKFAAAMLSPQTQQMITDGARRAKAAAHRPLL